MTGLIILLIMLFVFSMFFWIKWREAERKYEEALSRLKAFRLQMNTSYGFPKLSPVCLEMKQRFHRSELGFKSDDEFIKMCRHMFAIDMAAKHPEMIRVCIQESITEPFVLEATMGCNIVPWEEERNV